LDHPNKLEDAFSALFTSFFVERRPVEKPEVTQEILAKLIGKDQAAAIIEKSQTPEVKKLLAVNTERALADGAFGLPWFTAVNRKGEKESFWGFDHIGQVANHLGLEKPRAGKEGGWRAVL